MASGDLTRMLRHRMLNLRQTNCIFVHGKKGLGKSFLSLRLACELDKNFSVDRVAFSSDEFVDLINQKLPPGSCLIYDEIGVGANSRNSQTSQNKSLSYIAQTIRPYAYTVFFVTLSWGIVDSQVRNLMDFCIAAQGFDTRTNISRFKFFAVEPNPNEVEPIRKHLYFPMEGGGELVKHMSWTCSIPDENLQFLYNAKRRECSDRIFEEAKQGKRGSPLTGMKTDRPRLSEIARLVSRNPACKVDKLRYSRALIREQYPQFGLTQTDAREIVQLQKKFSETKKKSVR